MIDDVIDEDVFGREVLPADDDDDDGVERALRDAEEYDAVNHPAHYTSHPSGVECIEITRHLGFNCGNAVKYLWRAGLKVQLGEQSDEARLRDLEKARWYLEDEIAQRRLSLRET